MLKTIKNLQLASIIFKKLKTKSNKNTKPLIKKEKKYQSIKKDISMILHKLPL
jgi:hypothetical protein